MDDDYNAFTIEHSRNIEDIHIANPEALICLKARAYTEMLDRKAEGEQVDSRDIEKHKKDVFRLIAMLSEITSQHKVDTVVTHTAPSFCELQNKSGLLQWAIGEENLIDMYCRRVPVSPLDDKALIAVEQNIEIA